MASAVTSLLGRARDEAARVGGRAAGELHALRRMREAGMIGGQPPGRVLATLRALDRYGTLGSALPIAALRDGDAPGLRDERGELTFAKLDQRSNAVANAWRARGARDGLGVGILCRNHRGFVDATFAAAKLGARIVYLNTDFAGPALREVCAREGVQLLVHDEEFAAVVESFDAPLGRWLGWTDGDGDAAGDVLERAIARGDKAPPPPPSSASSVVLLTSGTTGTPKGAPRPQGRSVAPLGALLSRAPFRAGEVTCIAPPLFHALGFAQLILAVGMGSQLVTRRRFDPELTLRDTADSRATALVVVPVQLQRMLALGRERVSAYDLQALRIVFVGGSQLSAPLATSALEAFGDVIYNMYGSTEVAWATIANPEDLRAAPGCAGKPLFGTTVKLLDDDGRALDGPGRTGRVFVGNGFEFEGYTGGGSKEVIDGLMSTGDVGHFDADGRLFIDGRDDDMIVSGGENVFPGEVEDLLAGHPDVLEAAVIGVPDEQFGQRLKAFVVARDDERRPGEDELREFVRSNLARYKVPRDVEFLDALPRNPAGKVLRRTLSAPADG